MFKLSQFFYCLSMHHKRFIFNKAFYLFHIFFYYKLIFNSTLKGCQEKLFVYILRLLAGKFRPICTELPLTTFLAKIFTRVPLNFQPKKKLRVNANFSIPQKKSKQSKNLCSNRILIRLCFYLHFLHEMICGSS